MASALRCHQVMRPNEVRGRREEGERKRRRTVHHVAGRGVASRNMRVGRERVSRCIGLMEDRSSGLETGVNHVKGHRVSWVGLWVLFSKGHRAGTRSYREFLSYFWLENALDPFYKEASDTRPKTSRVTQSPAGRCFLK